jgi:hypothetical protein
MSTVYAEVKPADKLEVALIRFLATKQPPTYLREAAETWLMEADE